MARRSAAHSQAAREAWRALFDTFMLTHPERQATLGEHGLTPNDSRALNSLDRKDGRALGTLARQWNCDPSTATWVVDRLERGAGRTPPLPHRPAREAGAADRQGREIDEDDRQGLLRAPGGA